MYIIFCYSAAAPALTANYHIMSYYGSLDSQITGWIHTYKTPDVSSSDEEPHLVCHSLQVLHQLESWFLLSPDHAFPRTNNVQWNRDTKNTYDLKK